MGLPGLHPDRRMDTAARETLIEKWRAFALALLVHGLAFALAFLGLSWQGAPPPNRGLMDAVLITAPQSQAADDHDPAVTPPPKNALAPQALPTPSSTNPLPTVAPALVQENPKEKGRQDEIQRQPSDSTPNPIARGLLPSNTPAVQPPPPIEPAVDDVSDRGSINELRGLYVKAIKKAAYGNWVPTGVPEGVHCRVLVTQAIGGDVTDISYEDCPFDAASRDTIEHAVRNAQMPYVGFETVFMRQVGVDFCQPDAACAP